jgi:hypothetical protein
MRDTLAALHCPYVNVYHINIVSVCHAFNGYGPWAFRKVVWLQDKLVHPEDLVLVWKKSGAKQRITVAKRGGSRSMVAVLWRGRPSLAAHPLRRLRPGNGQTRA